VDANSSLYGITVRPRDAAALTQAIDQAFHYRGDVTVGLASGEHVQGYVCNREAETTCPLLQLFVAGEKDLRRIFYRDIVTISFTGEDTASGKDWEAWREKKDSERQSEAASIEAAARARGHL
jgi:hypothetical protein